MESKLMELLNQYTEEYKNLKEEYQQKRTKQTLYEELLQILSNYQYEENKLSITILLNTIYGNNIYVDEFYQILLQKDKLKLIKDFIEKINKDYIELKDNNKILKIRINRNFEMFKSAKSVKTSMKYRTPISESKNDIFNIKRIISYYEASGLISRKEELLLINEIELYNRKLESSIKNSPKENDYTESLYNEIPNILTIGYQEHDAIEVSQSRKPSLDKFVKEITNLINVINSEEINELLESYKKYNLDNSEYNYILVKILDTYLEDLLTLYELLIDKKVYSRRKARTDVIKDYYQTLEKYLIIRNYYNKSNEYVIKEDTNEEVEDEEPINEASKKILIYSRSEINLTKDKIISDMSDIPYEYYENIYDLLVKFKEGKIGNKKIKPIIVGNKSQGHFELKDDNIRIVLKHVKDNIYNVFGVLIKKANNDMNGYKIINSRTIPDISTEDKLKRQLELSEITEKELYRIVQEKGRRNGRK